MEAVLCSRRVGGVCPETQGVRGRKAVAMAFTAHFAGVEESETQRLATTFTSLRISPSLSGPQFRPNGNSGLEAEKNLRISQYDEAELEPFFFFTSKDT